MSAPGLYICTCEHVHMYIGTPTPSTHTLKTQLLYDPESLLLVRHPKKIESRTRGIAQSLEHLLDLNENLDSNPQF